MRYASASLQLCGVDVFGMRGVARCDGAAVLTQPVLGLVYPPKVDPLSMAPGTVSPSRLHGTP